MKKFSRRLTTLKSKVEPKLYTINEAVSILKATSNAKFKETAEAHIALGLSPFAFSFSNFSLVASIAAYST
ncbi:hypothetical protein, partial [Actinomadura verrucosospora]|uniref:hypothetical protein n=1 Tax=Actinomadura verrucosospora TaxID=46165 RepID=UPI003CD07851